MTKINHDKIKKQAKEILDKFESALSSIKETNLNIFVDREDFERTEKEKSYCDEEFKIKMLDNAPQHNKDFIIVEKGNWK